jgi:hypothetical protein
MRVANAQANGLAGANLGFASAIAGNADNANQILLDPDASASSKGLAAANKIVQDLAAGAALRRGRFDEATGAMGMLAGRQANMGQSVAAIMTQTQMMLRTDYQAYRDMGMSGPMAGMNAAANATAFGRAAMGQRETALMMADATDRFRQSIIGGRDALGPAAIERINDELRARLADPTLDPDQRTRLERAAKTDIQMVNRDRRIRDAGINQNFEARDAIMAKLFSDFGGSIIARAAGAGGRMMDFAAMGREDFARREADTALREIDNMSKPIRAQEVNRMGWTSEGPGTQKEVDEAIKMIPKLLGEALAILKEGNK